MKENFVQIKTKRPVEGLATRFALEIVREHRELIKSVVLFGSAARYEQTKISDIDIIVIVDDTLEEKLDLKSLEKEFDRIGENINKKISVQAPFTLTNFWEAVRDGQPTIHNILRDGVVLYDCGFFKPVKRMLKNGVISFSLEMVEKLRRNGGKRIDRANIMKTHIVMEDCYKCIVESSQAALMTYGINPVNPRDLPSKLKSTLVKKNLLKEKDLKPLNDILSFVDKCKEKEEKIKGSELDKWIEKAELYTEKLNDVIENLHNIKLETPIDETRLKLVVDKNQGSSQGRKKHS